MNYKDSGYLHRLRRYADGIGGTDTERKNLARTLFGVNRSLDEQEIIDKGRRAFGILQANRANITPELYLDSRELHLLLIRDATLRTPITRRHLREILTSTAPIGGIFPCSDGRKALFELMGTKFLGYRVAPTPGVEPLPRVLRRNITSYRDVENVFADHPIARDDFFTDLEDLFREGIRRAAKAGQHFPIRVISHYDSERPNEGCAAHGNTDTTKKAQNATLILVAAIAEWLKTLPSKEAKTVALGRDIYDTHAGYPMIREAGDVDTRQQAREEIECFAHYKLRRYPSAFSTHPTQDTLNGLADDLEFHAEGGIRFSQDTQYSVAPGATLFNVVLGRKLEALVHHTYTLAPVLEKHHGRKNPEAPFLFHIDYPANNKLKREVANQLLHVLQTDTEIHRMLRDPTRTRMKIIMTEMDRASARSRTIPLVKDRRTGLLLAA